MSTARWGLKAKMLIGVSVLMLAALTAITGYNLRNMKMGMQAIARDVSSLGNDVQVQQKTKLTEVEAELLAAEERTLKIKATSLAALVALVGGSGNAVSSAKNPPNAGRPETALGRGPPKRSDSDASSTGATRRWRGIRGSDRSR